MSTFYGLCLLCLNPYVSCYYRNDNTLDDCINVNLQLVIFFLPKLKAAKLEIRDLQVEFAAERDDYLASIRRLEREMQLLQGLLERMVTLVRRDCNYSNLERLRKEAMWDEESGMWRLPEVLVQKTALPAGEFGAAARPWPCDMFVSDGLGIISSEMMLVSDGQDVSDSQQCLRQQPAALPDSQDAGTRPRTQQRLSWYSVTQILKYCKPEM